MATSKLLEKTHTVPSRRVAQLELVGHAGPGCRIDELENDGARDRSQDDTHERVGDCDAQCLGRHGDYLGNGEVREPFIAGGTVSIGLEE